MIELPPPSIVVPAQVNRATWHRLPALPSGTAVAGAYVAVLHDLLVIAGGASFPDGKTRTFVDRIHAMKHRTEGTFAWKEMTATLPRAAGYGAAIPWDDSLVLIGGTDREVCHADVFRMRLDPFSIDQLPKLPLPLAHFAAARVGTVIVVAGGQSSPAGRALGRCFQLDLAVEPLCWVELPSWPGPPRTAPVGVALDGDFYLLGGREARPGHPTRPLTDAFELNVATRAWRRLPDVGVPAEPAAAVMAATAIPLDRDRFLVFGGGAAGYLVEREHLERELATAKNTNDRELTTQLTDRLLNLSHPGFQRALRVYDRRTERWSHVGDMPFVQPPVTTTAVVWNDIVVLPSGEIRPRIRTEEIWAAPLGDFLR